MGAFAATNLVVMDDEASGLLGEFAEVAQIRVGDPRAAMKHKKRQRATT